MRMHGALAGLAVALALGAVPSMASGATVGESDGALRYSAGPGETNWLEISLTDAGDYRLYDGGGFDLPGVPTDVGPGCRREGSDVICDSEGVDRIGVTLRDGADRLIPAADLPAPFEYSGGAGVDSIEYSRSDRAVEISANRQADDGAAGRDNVHRDVEELRGSRAADTLRGSPRGSDLFGDLGADELIGGPGNDHIAGGRIEDSGTDSGLLLPQGHDTIRCGAGSDSVLADRGDHVAHDCEVVGKPYCQPDSRAPDAGCTGGYRYLGSDGADRIRPDRFATKVFAYGRGGGDRMFGGTGSDQLHGEGGDDVMRARDERHDYPDTIRCGTGHDVVYADPWDTVARNCETVHRAAAH
jgi:RTX calcium-binding nonapeptide repeat (4 copies)